MAGSSQQRATVPVLSPHRRFVGWPHLDLVDARQHAADLDPGGTILALPVGSAREAVREIVAGIAEAARLLYPAWLPDAAGIDTPAGSGAAAVRAIGRREALRGLALGAVVEPLAAAAGRQVRNPCLARRRDSRA